MKNENYWKVNTDKYNVVCENMTNEDKIFTEMQKRAAEKTKGKDYYIMDDDENSFYGSYNFMGEKSLFGSRVVARKRYEVPSWEKLEFSVDRNIIVVNGFNNGATIDWDVEMTIGRYWYRLSDYVDHYEFMDELVKQFVEEYVYVEDMEEEVKEGSNKWKKLEKKFFPIVEKEWLESVKELDEIANSMADKQI